MVVGTGQTTEVGAVADPGAGDEEAGTGRLRLGDIGRNQRERDRRCGQTQARNDRGKFWHRILRLVFVHEMVDGAGYRDINTRRCRLFRLSPTRRCNPCSKKSAAERTAAPGLKKTDWLAHVPAKWIRFADKDMRQHENLRRFPVLLDHRVIQYDREAL
jgi:hypothetical protein